MFEEEVPLIEKHFIDHHILYHTVKIHGQQIHIYSLNIAQQNHLRTMIMFNKVHSFIKGKDISSSYIKTNFFNQLPNVILKHNLHLHKVDEGSKVEITNKTILKDLQQVIPLSFEKVYLRRYTPTGERETDEIFEKRFKKTNYIYVDIVFEKETNGEYRQRIHTILETMESLVKGKKNCLLCFQEISPFSEFEKELKMFNNFVLMDRPTIEKNRSTNILLGYEFPHDIRRLTSSDKIIDIFANKRYKNGLWKVCRNINQNVKYLIPNLNLNLYVIHGHLYDDYSYLKEISNIFIHYLKEQDRTSVIIGDFNFKMRELERRRLQKEFFSKNCFASFVSNITNRVIKTYDGIIVYPNRP